MNSETRIKFQCPFCSRPMNAPANAAGKKGRCKDCNNEVTVPKDEMTEPPTPTQETETPRPASKKPMIPRWARTPGAMVLMIVICGISYNVSQWTETEIWTSDDGLSDYHDTYGFWSQKIQQRSIYGRDENDEPVSMAYGPMSESGQPHGEWAFTMFQPRIGAMKQFYWYGDKVSEGEWHTRSGE